MLEVESSDFWKNWKLGEVAICSKMHKTHIKSSKNYCNRIKFKCRTNITEIVYYAQNNKTNKHNNTLDNSKYVKKENINFNIRLSLYIYMLFWKKFKNESN